MSLGSMIRKKEINNHLSQKNTDKNSISCILRNNTVKQLPTVLLKNTPLSPLGEGKHGGHRSGGIYKVERRSFDKLRMTVQRTKNS
ncbi:hypothetical protein [uncultured Mucilaginibacter sp.]|uniref:hypothetical protein n=1 Tax=uncultured Mucilaginibacter sp. TaxID=797541 RepID=UPI0026026BB1|nr:hypothetical protein [uncultured Mucilaginibacter sp.]